MVSFWVAIVTAFVGAAAAGVIPWVQTTRDQVSGAKIARAFLIENLTTAKERLDAALHKDTNWWWPPVAPPPTDAWHEYHAVLRDDLGAQPGREVAETIKKLDDLNAWAVTQWGQQEKRLDIVTEAYRGTPEQVEASRNVLDQLKPRYDLGERERKALQEAHASVETTLVRVPAIKSRVASRRRRGWLLLVVPVVLAIVAAVILVITIQPTFTSDKLDQALAKEFPGAVVSCDQSHEAQWDCFVAYPAAHTTAASVRQLLATQYADIPKIAQAGGTSSGLSKILEFLVEKEGKTNNYFGILAGEEPPVEKGLKLKPDGLPSVPKGPTATDTTITGSVG